jgi:GH43 family beta-xylosidase
MYTGAVDKYDIVPWRPMPSSGIIGVQQIAENTAGCNVFVIDKSSNKYSLKAINFNSLTNIPFSNRLSTFETYARMPNTVSNRAYRIDNDHHEADPCVTYFNNYIYYTFTGALNPHAPGAERSILFKRAAGTTLTENILNDTNAPYITTGFTYSRLISLMDVSSFSSFWAPEMQFINNVCYYLFSVSPNATDDRNSQVYYIYCTNTQNITNQNSWLWGGKLDISQWVIDPTIFTLGGNHFLAASRGYGAQYIGVFKLTIDASMRLAIDTSLNEMRLPVIKYNLGRNGYKVNEAPTYITDNNGKPMLFFSAEFYDWPTYCLGAYEYNSTDMRPASILTASNWSSPSTVPLFKSDPTTFPNTQNIRNLRGTGHNSFFIAPNNKKYIVYHATISDDRQGQYKQPNGSDSWRIVFFQEFTDPRSLGGILHSGNINLGGGFIF